MTATPFTPHHPTRTIVRVLIRVFTRVKARPLTIAGFASLDIAAFIGNTIAGWAVTGFSLLLLDWTLDNENEGA